MSIRRLAAGFLGLAIVASIAGRADGGTTRYVSPSGTESGGYTSWATAAKTIQKAVGVSSNGDTVIVTNGVYSVTSHIAVTNGVTVLGLGGASGTIIDGGGVSRGFYLSHPNAVVDGFCIQNGRSGEVWSHGGGIIVVSNGVVQNCIIRNCRASWAGGVDLSFGGTLRNCLVVSNVVMNANEPGGGVKIQNSGTVENCTIVGNQAPLCSGLCFDNGGNYRVINSVIDGNIGSDNVGFYNTGPVADISYSCFTPYIAGAGNTTNPPLFAAGYRLSSGLPCIDKGTNLAWMAGATDLDGNPRIANGAVDMGAYEYGFVIGIRFSAIDVTWNSASGKAYQVQSCTNLLGTNWANVGSSVTATGATCYAPDWIRDSGVKYYRVLPLP